MHRSFASSISILSISLLTCSASAGLWFEVGDAGQNGIAAAQIPVGVGTLIEITGQIDPGADVDVYQINITDYVNFQAEAVGPLDTMLWLFKADGKGQVMNDDYPGLGNLSRLTAQGVQSNGIYYLAISRFNGVPRDAANNVIFGSTPWPGPDPAQMQAIGSAGAFTNWTSSTGAAGGYKIFMTGVSFVPGPGAMSMLLLAGLLGSRKRMT